MVAATRDGLTDVPGDASVVVAVSGGPDSTALAFLVAEARPDLALHLVHVRHGLRDDRADVAAVTTTARFLGTDLEVVDVTVEPTGEGPEAAARHQRWAALERAARATRAKWILTGHTADDQAETVLLRMARGTGIAGLAGIDPAADGRCRPLLRLRRRDVHAFVHEEGLEVAHDPTNDDVALTRNRLRHRVMPDLDTLGPDVVGALARLAALARDDEEWMGGLTDELVGRLVRRVGPVHAVPVDDLAELAPAAARRLVRRLVVAARPHDAPPAAAEVERVRMLRRGAIDLPGAEAVAAGGWLAVAPLDLARPAHVDLVVDGRTAWPSADWLLEATSEAGAERGAQLGLLSAWRPPAARIPEDLAPPGGRRDRCQVVLGGLGERLPRLVVRPRRPGDRVQTAAGTRKLQDVFVDAGVPRPTRDLLPVVATEERVLWVPGLVADEPALRTGRAVPQLHLAIRRLR
nr:tRNA lysidine(34) synthetase TilS [Salsipaludibacter albus]